MSKGLLALVADVQQEKTLATLLHERQPSLGIRPITFDIFRHPRNDPGVYHEAAALLAPYVSAYDYALVVLDAAWEGAPGGGVLRQSLMESLQRSGWAPDHYQVVVIDPELEMWVWADSPVTPEVLRTTWADIRALAQRRDYWRAGQAKPHAPKALLEGVLRQQRRPRSAAIFQELARRLGLASCTDPAFVLLREKLAEWFGAPKD